MAANKAINKLKLHRYTNFCNPTFSQEYSLVGGDRYSPNRELIQKKASFPDPWGSYPVDFHILDSQGKLALVEGNADPRFTTKAGINVGATLTDVKNAYQDQKQLHYREVEREKRHPRWFVELKKKGLNDDKVLRIKFFKNIVIGFTALKLGAKVQDHDCGYFETLQ